MVASESEFTSVERAGMGVSGVLGEARTPDYKDRGYDRIEYKLRQLGARIKRTKVRF